MTIARLKLDPVCPNLTRLGDIVLAVEARLRTPGTNRFWDDAQRDWPESIELARSIEQDEGWLLFVNNSGEAWEGRFLYLHAPQLYLRSAHMNVKTRHDGPHARWSYTMEALVDRAKTKRRNRLGQQIPPFSPQILTDMREQEWLRWGMP